jgi:8-oxo-dGTP pyrophosphatase MutT (NUDIX family)
MENIMYQGHYVKVTEELIDGINWERCYLRDGVIVYAVDNDGKFIMINEKRPHEDQPIRLRFVAGHLEPGLSVIENANKELQEEIGLRANKLEEFFKIKSSGSVNNSVHFVLATDLVIDPIPNPDGDVIVSIEKFTYDELFNHIMSDHMRWSSAVLGFLRLHHVGQKMLKNHGVKLN